MSNSTLISDVVLARMDKGLSVRQLGREIGVSFSTLARMERGEGTPSLGTRAALLEWLGLDATQERQQLARQTSGNSLLARVAALEVLIHEMRGEIHMQWPLA